MEDLQMRNPEQDSRENKQRSSMDRALGEDLMERILESSNVKRAWQQVKQNHGAPGIDGMTIEEFPTYARNYWQDIRQALLDGKYQPSPVRRVYIPKPSGGKRALGIPTVLDRVIQQAIAQVLQPIFDPEFSESSFGYRPGRSALDAVRKVSEDIADGCEHVVDIDLSKFFDTVNHDVLMVRVARRVRDKRLLKLIGAYLRAGVEVNGEIEPTAEGVLQGGPLSPLLSNILLDDLDKELEKRGHRFTRYADDFAIQVRSERAGERVMQSVTRWLKRKLKLKVNPKKSSTKKATGLKFLGFVFRGKRFKWNTDSFRRFKSTLKKLTGRSWFVSMDYRIRKLNEYIRGWINYFGIGQRYNECVALDHWLRRRIRMCYWKQWRYARVKVRELLKLGTNKKQAILTAISRKGSWHLSKTLATQTGMTNTWIHNSLGLVSIRNLWVALHYPT
ncbi:group II intron reverse transcriptase/maturase [Oligoflexia bacterium]|nr:group II intron reverse transcriptase/maturase [Oligoflexia bacterium]